MITDFLPLPVYDASIISTTFGTTIDASAPPADSVKYGPDHTFSRVPVVAPPLVNPTVSLNATANSVEFDFGTFDNLPPESESVIDILLSTTITDAPMANGLPLTNMATTSHGTTNAGNHVVTAITLVTLTEPDLNIRKGIVSTTNTNASFRGRVAPPGITFEAPGIVSGSSFSGGTINSSNLGTALNADLNNVDADDLVKFAITIENSGSSSAGVFDIQLRDSLPAGFVVPTTGPGLNLEIFDGTGTPIPFSTIGAGLFDPAGGIELIDPGATPASGSPAVDGGALDEFDPADGRNIAVITFDLQVDRNVVADASLLNTAVLFNFAGTEGGEDHTNPTDLTDTAITNISAPSTAKTLIQSSINNASNAARQAVIGEIVTYELEVEIPEGTLPGASILDTLDLGLAFVDVLSVSTGSLSVENTIGLGTAPANTNITSNGRRIEFDFGDIDNNDTDNSTPETITIRYRAVVLNISRNQSSPVRNLNNAARLRWTGGNLRPARARTVRVIEPDLDIGKSATPVSLDVADTVTYTVTLTHDTASTDAYDVTLADVVPAGLTYVPGSWMNTAGLAPDTITDAGTLNATWAVFPDGSTATFQFDAVVDVGALAGTTFTNTATADWSSLPGPTPNDLSDYNANSRERTGSGGLNDYLETSSADIEIAVSSAKSIVSTSEGTTSGTDVTIGEIVRYRIAVLFPESVGPDFAILDNLPDGLQFVDDGTAMVALVSDGGLSSSTLPASFEVLGNSPTVIPTEVLPASAISGGPFSSGTDPTFSLGTLTNADSDPDGEYVVLEFNAIVSNVAGNSAGVDLANSGSTLVSGTQVGLDSTGAIVNIVEPSISNLTKSPSVTTVDGGDPVTYRVRYSASNAADTTTAFDVQTVETLPPELTGLTNVRVLRNGSIITTGFVNASTASLLAVSIDEVTPGDVIEILYDVTVVDTTPTGTVINNSVDVLYTSLPGTNGTTINPTGSTSGTSGGSDGERTGSGGVNSYFGNTSSTVTVNSHEISGFVYHDANNNGIFDEPAVNGIGAVVVRIVGTDHLGNMIDATQSTLADGSYSFSGLRPGSYSVSETQPIGFFNGLDSIGAPAMSAINVSRRDDLLGTFTFPVGAASTSSVNNNFGELVPASITGNVYVDANNDGLLSGELPIGAVPISLTGVDDLGNAVSLNTTTNGTGGYSFSGLRPGTYTVTETTQPAAYLDGLETRDNTTPIPGSGGGPDTISGLVLTSGQTDGDNNFGEIPPGTIRGRVFTDANNDGLINGSDQGIGSVDIQLNGTDVFGNVISLSTTTAADGTYSFSGLMEGTYTVTEPTQPDRYFDGLDSLVGVPIGGSNSSDQITGVFLPSGGEVADNNFGEVPDVGPTGYVYIDTNTNGTRESTEPGIAGVEITLTGTGLDVFGNPIPTRTAFTGPDGFYEFLGIPPGNYTITETQPAAFQDAAEQNGTPAAGTVNDDQFTDLDLTDHPTISGEYNFGEVSPTSSLAGAVYVDSNNNGVRDPSEIGLAGVTVTLIDSGGTSYQVVTDVNGEYRFLKMFPGQYRLVQTQPTNFIDGRETRGTAGGVVSNDQFSRINVGLNADETGYLFGEAGINPALISKRAFLTSSNPGIDFTGPPGSGVAAVNAPLADPAGYVYVDTNGNGMLDYPEPGIPNVIITVRGVTNDGVSVEQETRTDASGFYQFAFLRPGTYALYQQQPIGFADGRESIGTLGGIIGDDSFTNIVIRDGDFGENYNFGELPLTSVVVGDSNQDGIFDSADLIRVFQANEYEDELAGNSTFAEGDWNGDGDFDSTDLVLAFQSGHYVQALEQILDDLARRRRTENEGGSTTK